MTPEAGVRADSPVQGGVREALSRRYDAVRGLSRHLCEPLAAEDMVVQSMPDTSPTKWHLAHTTWFFETFVLEPFEPSFTPYDDVFGYLFNSYYNAVGERHPRPNRGMLTRPTVEQVMCYRANVDDRTTTLLEAVSGDPFERLAPIVEIGLHHEQQHQELIQTDLKHMLAQNPMQPAYCQPSESDPARASKLGWIIFDEQVRWIGHGGDGFAFDNESPRHRVFCAAFEIADRLVTNAEYTRFIDAGGYEQPKWWLDEGWATVQRDRWRAPLYWQKRDERWHQFTLAGVRPVDPHEPVCHVSLFEADAYARWSDARLPTEVEWETACAEQAIEGTFAESGRFHPAGAPRGSGGGVRQAFGDVWQWTRSQYGPYPGYRPAAGALGEYNGKFMCNQFVLRGGSCATPRSHVRVTYRNFFHPSARWQFSGIRLARDVEGSATAVG